MKNSEAEKPFLYLLGAGGHGRVAADVAEQSGQFRAYGYLDDADTLNVTAGLLKGRLDLVDSLVADDVCFVVTVGNNIIRQRLQQRLLALGAQLVTLIHPSAIISPSATIGKGSVVFPGAIINAGARVGDGVIINSGAIIEHDCTIANGCHIGPAAALGGGVSVGEGSWVGIGASVIELIDIGEQVIVGAGAVVIRNCGDQQKLVGVPARVISGENNV